MTDERAVRVAAAQMRMAELGQKFIDRTLGEIGQMRQGADQLAAGNASALTQIQHFSHKIRGTGATLGFEAVSDCGADIERLAIEGVTGDTEDPEYLGRLRGAIDALHREIDSLRQRTT
jgi:HPt (histidine-containing phosphotransfer) domain-containing protein